MLTVELRHIWDNHLAMSFFLPEKEFDYFKEGFALVMKEKKSYLTLEGDNGTVFLVKAHLEQVYIIVKGEIDGEGDSK
jgi:hypothetical protein